MHTSAPRPESPDTRPGAAPRCLGPRRYPTLGRIRGGGPHPAMWSGTQVRRPWVSSAPSGCPRQPAATIRGSELGPTGTQPAAGYPSIPRGNRWRPVSWSSIWGSSCTVGFRTRLIPTLFVSLAVIAALIPALLPATHFPSVRGPMGDEAVWPKSFEGRELHRLPLSAVDQRFADRFPGQIARFTDGKRIIIARRVQEPTPMLHSAAVCFRGLGYRVDTPRAVKDGKDVLWSCFGAERDGESYRVCERIYDRKGGAWTDVSSWYWAAILGRTERPWYALTVVTQR
jgi:hypothetical protein